MAEKEGYVESKGRSGLSPWVGWGISTLLLFFLNRHSDSSNTSSQQPSKYTEDNVNCIGQPVPVVLGRAMIKNPLVSYYGDFDNEPYTEEYGMHSGLDAAGLLWPFLLSILTALLLPSEHKSAGSLEVAGPQVVGGRGGTLANPTVVGYVVDTDNGSKFNMLVAALLNLLISLLLYLFTQHLGRTTIQKGFLYYLGWQHIICWTGRNIGIKKLWMNVYDSEIEESTETGVWDNSGHIAWEKDNINGIEAYIDDKEMFGGYDEQGGFTGSVRFYFGNHEQPKDPWMVHSMNQDTIEESLRGLTPKYPMYLTCVVSNSSKDGGAYIGKQATIPEMWFEVVNYPSRLADSNKIKILRKFSDKINDYYNNILEYINSRDIDIIEHLERYTEDLSRNVDRFNQYVDRYIENPDVYTYPDNVFLSGIKNSVDNLINDYPISGKREFETVAEPLRNLCINGYWHLGQLDDDLNPAEAIYEILMNKYWGCGYVEDRIDVDSLIDLGVVCEEEKLGVSCLINRTAQANDYVSKILSHINGVKYDDPKTGKLTFKLIRNDYDVNTIKTFNVSNTESCEFSRLDWSETTSAVEVTFTDASNKYDTGQFTFNDISNRFITGFYTSKSVEGEYFTTNANAMWLAKLTQLSNGYPLSAVNLVTNRYAYDVTIGEPIKISWEPYGLSQIVYRVTDIDYSNLTDGKISITAIEDVFGFDKLDFDVSDSPQWTDPTEAPTDISRYMFEEEPYELSRSLDTYMFAYAAQPDTYTVYWDIYRRVDGNFVKSSQSMLWSTVGRLTYGYSRRFEYDTVGFDFSFIGSNGKDLIDQKIAKIEKYPSTYTVTSGLNLAIIDNEWISYSTIEKLTNGHYQLKGIIRGVFDTIPETHTSESLIFFVENRQNVAGLNIPVSKENYPVSTEYLEICSETRNTEQRFSISRVEEHDTKRRSEQPSIMANLKFGLNMGIETLYEYDYVTEYIFSGDILFSFFGRNKYNNYGIIKQTDDSTDIEVAQDTKNVIRIRSQNKTAEWKYDAFDIVNEQNIESMQLLWSQFCEIMEDKLKYNNTVVMDIMTYNSTKELYSWASYNKSFSWRTPRLVGIVADEQEAQELANTYIQGSGENVVTIPDTAVSHQFSLLYSECPIIVEGVYAPDLEEGMKGQDGRFYRLTNVAYRIVCREGDTAILYKFTVDNYYVIRTDFTQLEDNYADYWQFGDSYWKKYNIIE